MQVTTIGFDLAKNVFQVHGIAESGAAVVRKRLRRAQVLAFFTDLPPCLVGMEACASAHHWGRELMKLGHAVKLIPPSYVKPYVRRGKNDAADAEAICEAVTRPNMRFVPVKTTDQQAVLMLHRTRALLIRQRTMLANAFRAHLAEFGIIVAQGIGRVASLIERIFGDGEEAAQLPRLARSALAPLAAQFLDLAPRIKALEAELLAWHRTNEESRRLETIPGVGFITATAIAATVTDPSHFRSEREFAAWLGLTPRQNSSAGKPRFHLEDGRSLSAQLALRRSDGGHSFRAHQGVSSHSLDQSAAGQASRHGLSPSRSPTRRPASHGLSWPGKRSIAHPCLPPEQTRTRSDRRSK
jgi:transposase